MRIALAASALAICLCNGSAIAQSKPGEVAGKVTDIAGGVIPGARVTLKGRDTRTMETDKNGEYAFKNLRRGTYTVRVELIGFLPTVSKVSVRDEAVQLDAVLRVREIVQRIETYPLHQGEVAGTVTAIEGFILPGARVTLKGLDAVKGPDTVKGPDIRTAQTDKSGKYAFSNLRRGTYIVGFEFPGYQPTYVKVNVSDKPLTIDPVLPVRFIE
jgi:hypothetical protein